jgi:predicted nucleotidyltransferase
MPNRFKSLLEVLAQADVQFILIDGLSVRCATLDQLISLKNAAGRPKDFESVAELRAIKEEREKQ